jgi:hypothetical protein
MSTGGGSFNLRSCFRSAAASVLRLAARVLSRGRRRNGEQPAERRRRDVSPYCLSSGWMLAFSHRFALVVQVGAPEIGRSMETGEYHDRICAG